MSSQDVTNSKDYFFPGLSFKQINSEQESKIQRGKVTWQRSSDSKLEKSALPFKVHEALFMLPPFTAAVSAEK